jgi:hypothetical protein
MRTLHKGKMSSSKVKADAKKALSCDKERESRTLRKEAKDQETQKDNSIGKVEEAKTPEERDRRPAKVKRDRGRAVVR